MAVLMVESGRRLLEIDTQLDALGRITEVFDGVPLHRENHGRNTDMSVVCGERGAHVYRNARSPRFWGVSVWVGIGIMGRREHFLGSGWPTRRRAMEVAKAWTASGRRPDQEEIDRNWHEPGFGRRR